MTEANWQTAVYLILGHPDEPSILMYPGASGWMLPHVQVDGRIYSARVETVNAAVRQTLGTDVTILRCAFGSRDEESHQQTLIYTAETRQSAYRVLPGAEWVNHARLAHLTISPEDVRSAVEACLIEAETGNIPDLRPPWARRGWFDQASAWMQAELTRSGYTLTAPVEQVRSWGISCLLRAQTNGGAVYFKVATRLPLFGHEPLLMQTLSALYPDHVPTPLSINRERAWMLLADFGKSLEGTADPAVWEQAILTLGKIQRESIGRDLLAMGCLDRRLDKLAGQINPLLDDPDVVSRLTTDERERLLALVPSLMAMCKLLGEYHVPETLMHGDLNAGNIAVPSGKTLIFDWTDGCWAHPFFDLCPLQLDMLKFPNSDEVQFSLREAYLALWTDFEPMDRLREAWALAEVLGALHQAVSYQHIVAILEPTSKRELEFGLTFFLRKILSLHEQSPQIFTM